MMQIGWAARLVVVAQLAGKDKTPVFSVSGVNASGTSRSVPFMRLAHSRFYCGGR
jgi:hypothetical protein